MNNNPFSLNTIGGRSLSLDLLKGVAIIAVVLYHVGICEYKHL
jgi:peptidoglycan/LPS O-acetylase OafA/YrhL